MKLNKLILICAVAILCHCGSGGQSESDALPSDGHSDTGEEALPADGSTDDTSGSDAFESDAGESETNRGEIASGLLTAGDIDDHLNLDAYKEFVNDQLQENALLPPIDLTNPQASVIKTELPRSLDLMFIVDTTGSMGDEMAYLKSEFEGIVSSLQEIHGEIAMRFALVVYRDEGDEYVTKLHDFVNSVDEYKTELSDQQSGGGGDWPEAMDQALDVALTADWGEESAAKIAFLVADAPPHDENLQKTLDLAHTAAGEDIHIYPIASSGVGLTEEYMMRAIAYVTGARYLFLTNDSGVGLEHAEPSIPCYHVTLLDDLIRRIVSGELSGQRIEPDNAAIIRTVGEPQQGVCEEEEG